MPNMICKLDVPPRFCSKIPVELYQFLVECLATPVPHQTTLARLCRVNKAFRAEAERVLYRNVRCLSAESVSSFCRSVEKTKDRLSSKVKSIHLTTTAKFRNAHGLDNILEVLERLTGLREVSWDDSEFHHLDYAQNLPGPLHVLIQCCPTLDLHSLTCNFLVDRRIFTFLQSQPNLHEFQCRSYLSWNPYEQGCLPDGFLANLTTLHAPASFVAMLRGATLNIATLALSASMDNDIEERALLNMLGALCPSLINLRLYGNWQCSMLQVMEIVAERVLGLKTWVFQGLDPEKPKISELWGIVTRFRSLETLVMPPFTWSQAFCMHVTDGLVTSCPTLNRVAYYDLNKRSCCFVRCEPAARLKVSEEDNFALEPSLFDSMQPASSG
ncbi:hypothetical protein GLOTRDRAFT_106493 [Gloeophyllum trabeum ATCC 11539]|uniref:F-box domain-containing protein n=1 Tax=Gloeophyllum trabeum (strain ATCC 11539 / FP-39264 / Madison 617) TaxID=670483 RepID=S7RKQ2_GLOTA|nr:uncharacterized protein GLOTRDRAFT_106493 [Gloeophyllum trabeum ATCC 11539]EPQ54950.1 hypothetical protein GLOTRDRAFT_106493 [Gloeophyllum trabeum ATCC 11539]